MQCEEVYRSHDIAVAVFGRHCDQSTPINYQKKGKREKLLVERRDEKVFLHIENTMVEFQIERTSLNAPSACTRAPRRKEQHFLRIAVAA